MTTKGSGRPTQKTIAEMTGLAVTTVSRALQSDPKIADATREEVRRVADQIGYVPDRAAQRLRTGKTRVISLMLNPRDELLGSGNSMIAGISEALEGSEYHLIITPSLSGAEELDPISRLIENNLADGIILTHTRNFDERVRYLLEQNFPFICHGRTDFTQEHSFVDFDNQSFAYQAVRHLASKGSRKVAIILPDATLSFHQHLRYGFMKAVRELGLDYVIPPDLTLESSPMETRAWLDQLHNEGLLDAIDGYVCIGEISYLALHSGMRELGRGCGRDYHAVVKVNGAILEQIHPGVACVFEDIHEAGLLMGQGLLTRLTGREMCAYQIVQRPLPRFDKGVVDH